MQKIKEEIQEIAKREGLAQVSFCILPPEMRIAELSFAISLSFVLSFKIIQEIKDMPTRRYFYHYRYVNALLDNVTLKITWVLQKNGYNGLPIPASVITDWQELKGEMSHKTIAYLSGIGFWGKNSLIVSPKFSCAIRLASVLTDAPLVEENKPLAYQCPKDCKECIKACPAGAISEEGWNKERCLEKLKEFAKKLSLGSQYICGVCIRACLNSKKWE